MNTRINYMYRDASNYKSFNTAVVGGILSETDQHAIYYCCDDDAGQRYFIPHLVGLPEKTFDDFGQYDDDHPWFEIGTAFAEVTNEPPTVDLTAEQLVKNFRAMSGRWDEAIARGQAEEQKPFPILKSQSDPNATVGCRFPGQRPEHPQENLDEGQLLCPDGRHSHQHSQGPRRGGIHRRVPGRYPVGGGQGQLRVGL